MKNNKKIAILCNYKLLPERVGGMDYFFWQFDATCKANNIQVDWFFPNRSLHGEYGNLTIFDSSNQNVEPFFLDFYSQNNSEYTHIITHFVELCTPFFKKLKQLSKAEIIAIDHNPRPINGYLFKKRIVKKIKGFLFSRYVDQFVGVSHYTVNAIIKDFGLQVKSKTTVVFNGLDILKFKKKTNFFSNKKFIVVSHLRKEKGIQDLIFAVKDLKSYDFTIDIYGEGYFEVELREMIQVFELQKIITLKGSVTNLNELYCNYDYLIHPSHGETFCYSVVESLICNLPVITTRNQGNVLGLIIDNQNGFLFEEANSVELKNILKSILTCKSQIGENFLNATLDDFSLEQMVNQHFALLLKN
jgi:glycosyltransferase involved in cell wall biosynthesis